MYVKVQDFRGRLQREIDSMEGGTQVAAEKTGVSDRGLRRILQGRQETVSLQVFDKIATAFNWEHEQYQVHSERKGGGGHQEEG